MKALTTMISGNFSLSRIKNSVTKFFKLVTWKNIWHLLSFSAFILGIICGLWLILSLVGLFIIAAWAAFGTTSFSGDDSLSQLTLTFWHLTAFGKVMVVALAINSVNIIVRLLNEEDEIVKNYIDKFSNFFDED